MTSRVGKIEDLPRGDEVSNSASVLIRKPFSGSRLGRQIFLWGGEGKRVHGVKSTWHIKETSKYLWNK